MAQEEFGPTLTNVTLMGRQTVKFGLIFLVVLMVGRITVNGIVAYWKATHPEPPPPPTVGFGKLPGIEFPAQLDTEKATSYKLETATGTLTEFGDRSKVYFMPKATSSLLADQSGKATAGKLGYIFEPEVISTEIYRWNKSQPLLANLEMNIRTNNFKITTNYLALPELLVNQPAPAGFDAITKVKRLLNKADLIADDVATASGEIVYLKSLGGELTPAVSQSDADFIQVDINRNPIDGVYRMYTPKGYVGAISAILSNGFNNSDSIVALNYNYHEVDYQQVHTYPLRTSQSAWQLLQAGEGYIAELGTQENAIVRTVTLGFYDSFEEQDYLQPVYVFENSETGFMGLVPALDSQFIQKN
jgi:hypothetical protein